MRHDMNRLLRYMALATLLLITGGCLTTVPLSNGQQAELSIGSVSLRDSFHPVAEPIVHGKYHAINCVYTSSMQALGIIPGGADKLTLTIKQLDPTRLWVTYNSKKRGADGAVIDPTGKQHDFNFQSIKMKQSLTPEDFSTIAEEKKRQLALLPNVHVLNNFTLTIPEFSAADVPVGGTAAEAKAEDDEIWGDLVYRGMVQYQGVNSELFDVVHNEEAGPTVRGFLLWDTKDWVPALMDFNPGGETFKMRLVSCQQP